MPIPNDWDGETFCNFVVKWPNSTLWRIILRGVCSGPYLEEFWDASTGNVAQVIEQFQEALNFLVDELRCEMAAFVPIGAYFPFAGFAAPEGYLLCDGEDYFAADYPELFAVIGRTYGGSIPGGTFNVPDLRKRVPVGQDINDFRFNQIGETGGAVTHTLTINEIPSHNHSFPVSLLGAGTGGGTPGGGTNNPGYNATQNSGGGQAHNNLQPYIVSNYIIRAL